MTISLVTFSDESMSRARVLCVESAKRNGIDSFSGRGPGSVAHSAEAKANIELFTQPRGVGYWAWKPLIIRDEINWLPDTSILVYADAGVEFIAPVSHIIDRMDQDVFLFGNNWEHAHWCKRDVVEAVYSEHEKPWNLLSPWPHFGKQCQASVIFFRVSDYSRKFVAEWLKWCLFEGGRLIDDSPSQLPNHPEFREHRHDQSILTTLAYREGIKLHWWPAVYNRGGSPEFVYEKIPEYAGDDYPVLFSHHRRRDHEWPAGARWIGMTENGERFTP